MTFEIMDIKEKVGQNVRRLRKEKGFSQEQFAFETDLHRTYISDIERGNRNPTVTVIEKLAIALEVTPGVLLE